MKYTTKFIFSILCLIIVIGVASCKKDKATFIPEETFPDTASFVFVNRLGYKSDSINYGSGNYECFRSVCIESKYYNPVVDKSWIVNTCYNRNYPVLAYALSDSITQYKHPVYHGAYSAFKISLFWKNQSAVTVKALTYTSLSYPNGDLITTNKDTAIKFIWPTDTASGRFVKTYQYP